MLLLLLLLFVTFMMENIGISHISKQSSVFKSVSYTGYVFASYSFLMQYPKICKKIKCASNPSYCECKSELFYFYSLFGSLKKV